MYNVEIKMLTQTPVYTGDAFSKSYDLKPQSLLGSLRFWFEVFCFAAGELDTNYKKEELKADTFYSEVNEILEKQEVSLFEAKKEALQKLGISIPSQIFGCNGWEGFVRIKEIGFDKYTKKLKLPEIIYKDNKPAWYLPKGYLFGKAKVKFELADEKIGVNIIFPLLNFIQKYGFVGGKNNLGFGRVTFSLENTIMSKNYNLAEFSQFRFNNKTVAIDDVIEEMESFDDLINDDLVEKRKIGFFRFGSYETEKEGNLEERYSEMIKILLVKKSELRGKYRENNKKGNKEDNTLDKKRHFVFGSTVRDEYMGIKGPNATKIIPWISHSEKNKCEYGFISLILLQDFPGGRNS